MQTWGDAYRRLRSEKRFAAYFGKKGRIPGPNDFVFRAFVLVFQEVTGFTAGDPTNAPLLGPSAQIFDKGAIILGIAAGAYQQQQIAATAVLPYDPANNPGRRDLFKFFIQHTDGEKVTSDQEVLTAAAGAELNVLAQVQAEPLTGEGQRNEFPREIMVPPSTGFNISVQSFQPAVAGGNPSPAPTVHVVFHAVVPRGD
jgi:hypothetical protein